MDDKLPFGLMNAAGWAKTVEQVAQLTRLPDLSHIIVGSFTEHPREGNLGGTNFYKDGDGTSVNSLGLPNKGLPYLKQNLAEMRNIADGAGKLLIVSIANGETLDEYKHLAEVAARHAHAVEINAGCPNVLKGAEHKEVISYNLDMLGQVIDDVHSAIGEHPQWLKLSPYVNPLERVRIANLIKQHGTHLNALVTTNTFPNVGLRNEEHKRCLTVAGGLGGMAGSALKLISLTNAEHFRELLPDIDLVGVGGIKSGKDLFDYEYIGCVGMQVGTAFFWKENFRIFVDLVQEYVEYVRTNM